MWSASRLTAVGLISMGTLACDPGEIKPGGGDPDAPSTTIDTTSSPPDEPGPPGQDTGSIAGSCGVFCGFAPSASDSQAACIDQTFRDLGYALSSALSCGDIASSEVMCLACVTEIDASDGDCQSVTATCSQQ